MKHYVLIGVVVGQGGRPGGSKRVEMCTAQAVWCNNPCSLQKQPFYFGSTYSSDNNSSLRVGSRAVQKSIGAILHRSSLHHIQINIIIRV